MKVKNKIILALDLMQMQPAMQLLNDISKQINTIKIGYPLVLSQGLESITEIKESIKVALLFFIIQWNRKY